MSPIDRHGRNSILRRTSFRTVGPAAVANTPKRYGAVERPVPKIVVVIRNLLAQVFKPPEKTPAQQIEKFLDAIRGRGPAQLAGVLAGALLAKKTLDITRQVDIPFPGDIFDGSVPLDDAARERLTAYGIEAKRFRDECRAAGSILGVAVADGLETWIVTIATLTVNDNIAHGREIWRLLDQGGAGAETAFKFMVRREMTDIERTYLDYRPKLLMQ